ncbi:MAG: HEAT repeat domain-containing protein [Candidatus Binataceae bacterium]
MTEDYTSEVIARELGASEQHVRLRAILRLIREPQAEFGPGVIEALIGCLGSADKTVQRSAASALAGIAAKAPQVAASLRRAVESGEPRLRWAAIYTLGLMRGALELKVLPALIEALCNADGDVRWAASELVVRLGNEYPREVRRELLALAAGKNANGCKMALYCLRDLKFADEDVRALARRVSATGADHVRMAAMSLLAHLADGSEQSADILLRCLEEDRHEGVRRAAASALGRLNHRSERVFEALRRAVDDHGDPSLSRAANQALARLEKSDGATRDN